MHFKVTFNELLISDTLMVLLWLNSMLLYVYFFTSVIHSVVNSDVYNFLATQVFLLHCYVLLHYEHSLYLQESHVII